MRALKAESIHIGPALKGIERRDATALDAELKRLAGE
jgi:hypothetical protein